MLLNKTGDRFLLKQKQVILINPEDFCFLKFHPPAWGQFKKTKILSCYSLEEGGISLPLNLGG
jgi:hypothetical protein